MKKTRVAKYSFFLAYLHIFLFFLFFSSVKKQLLLAAENYSQREEALTFIDSMVLRHNFEEEYLLQLFAEIKLEDKETEKQINRTKPKRQAPKDWMYYHSLFVTEGRINEGLHFAKKYMKFLRSVSQKNKVPLKIIVATVGMETYYGKNMGKFQVFKNLLISAFDGQRRRAFYMAELEAFLLLCRKNGYNPLLVKGSYSGALGLAQFIPSSILKLGVDGDADGVVDLLNNPYDALASIGHYYKSCGWQAYKPIVKKLRKPPTSSLSADEKKKVLSVQKKNQEFEHWRLYKNFSILKCYNNSKFYALALFQLAEAIEKKALTSR